MINPDSNFTEKDLENTENICNFASENKHKSRTNMKTTPRIVKKVSIPDTLRTLSPGQSATYSCLRLGIYSSACVAVHRLNRHSGFTEYEIETADNGATYTVTRNHRRPGAALYQA